MMKMCSGQAIMSIRHFELNSLGRVRWGILFLFIAFLLLLAFHVCVNGVDDALIRFFSVQVRKDTLPLFFEYSFCLRIAAWFSYKSFSDAYTISTEFSCKSEGMARQHAKVSEFSGGRLGTNLEINNWNWTKLKIAQTRTKWSPFQVAKQKE